jgi:hypothetical protein
MLTDDLRALHNDAMPGKWYLAYAPGYLAGSQQKDDKFRQEDPLTVCTDAHTEEIFTAWTYMMSPSRNGKFVVAAHNLWPALVDVVEAWQAYDVFPSPEKLDAARDAYAELARAVEEVTGDAG